MKKTLHTLAGASLIVLLSGWGNTESNVAGDKKQPVNFSGTLATRSGQTIEVDNISIDNLYKQIPLYLKPDVAQPVVAATGIDCSKCCADKSVTPSSYKEFKLEGDPFTTLITTKADLAETSEIIVPHSDEVWVYQKDKQSSKLEFIEIILVSGDKKKTQTSYLIEKRKRVYADRINDAGPEEQTIPLEAIKSLKIDGWVDRKTQEEKTRKAHAAQQPMPETTPVAIPTQPDIAPAPEIQPMPAAIEIVPAPAAKPLVPATQVPAPEVKQENVVPAPEPEATPAALPAEPAAMPTSEATPEIPAAPVS